MIKRSVPLLLSGAILLGLAGCGKTLDEQLKYEAHFWQRANVTEALYMEGPKAQQMLHRDIANCVVELRELKRLGAIRVATPANTDSYGQTPDPDTPAGSLAQWESPERHGYLRAEHLPYHDFEACMIYKGWERLEHVPYNVADRSRATYIQTLTGERHRTSIRERQYPLRETGGDWNNLNE